MARPQSQSIGESVSGICFGQGCQKPLRMTIAVGMLASDEQSKSIPTVAAQIPRATQSHCTQKQQGSYQLALTPPAGQVPTFPSTLMHVRLLLVSVLAALLVTNRTPCRIRRAPDCRFQVQEQSGLLCPSHQQQSSCSFLNADGLFFFLVHPWAARVRLRWVMLMTRPNCS